MMYWTEEAIKAQLDGHFFYHNIEKGRVTDRRVPRDYIPSHTPKFGIPLEAPGFGARVWTQEEDDLLFQMFFEGRSFKEMARAIGISTALANNRFRALCIQRNVSPQRPNIQRTLGDELERRVVELHIDRQMRLKDVAKALKIPVNRATYLWSRWREANMREDAA